MGEVYVTNMVGLNAGSDSIKLGWGTTSRRMYNMRWENIDVVNYCTEGCGTAEAASARAAGAPAVGSGGKALGSEGGRRRELVLLWAAVRAYTRASAQTPFRGKTGVASRRR